MIDPGEEQMLFFHPGEEPRFQFQTYNLIGRSRVMAQEASKRATKLDFIPVTLPLLSDVDILDEELESLSSSGNVFSLFHNTSYLKEEN